MRDRPSGRPEARPGRVLLLTLLMMAPATCFGQVSGPLAASGCLDLSRPKAAFTATGKLEVTVFPGPPNYESVAAGDAAEATLLLAVPRAVCLDDGGEFADPKVRVDRVQVGATRPDLMRVLRRSRGQVVTVTGAAVAAHTGHHHAPLVLFADRITRR